MSASVLHVVEGVVAGQKVTVTVRESSVLVGARRWRLIAEGAQSFGIPASAPLDKPASVDEDLFNLRVFVYPNLISATVAQTGFGHWPITFEEFCDLPEDFFSAWQAAVREENKHWYEAALADPKALTGPTSASPAG